MALWKVALAVDLGDGPAAADAIEADPIPHPARWDDGLRRMWCTACEARWAITVANPSWPPFLRLPGRDGSAARRCTFRLRQVIALADEAPTLTDEWLRTRLLA